MSDDNLNTEIVRALGWTKVQHGTCYPNGPLLLVGIPPDRKGCCEVPDYSGDPGAALGLIEHTAALDKIGSIQISKSQNDWCCVVTYRRPPYIVDALADTLPLAIALACRNALVALSRVDAGADDGAADRAVEEVGS